MRFAQYRSMQAQVMQAVFKKVDKNQLGSVISMMLTNLFQIMIEARANLTQVGYVAGEEFPEFSDAKESLSKVFENTFMFGDLLLRRPTPIHVEYDQHTDWKDILTWAYYICSKSGVFLPEEQQFLDLIAKESGILPKDANFQNPYLDDSEKPRKRFEDPKPAEKKKPKKIKRGPRIIHSEF
ncbi:coiled-coil domain-containing protein 134 [Plakobranchus ocellatus]|uniref:Coiled-coil domain-containing protein 134 n=1 Tax=Plakobranchus ocellatus TaxID=259542 RepID=A0AAV3ZV15_9GAST|nr:coiled-coil domain-containing protein 134 [Plakobranchus ocellatus]